MTEENLKKRIESIEYFEKIFQTIFDFITFIDKYDDLMDENKIEYKKLHEYIFGKENVEFIRKMEKINKDIQLPIEIDLKIPPKIPMQIVNAFLEFEDYLDISTYEKMKKLINDEDTLRYTYTDIKCISKYKNYKDFISHLKDPKEKSSIFASIVEKMIENIDLYLEVNDDSTKTHKILHFFKIYMHELIEKYENNKNLYTNKKYELSKDICSIINLAEKTINEKLSELIILKSNFNNKKYYNELYELKIKLEKRINIIEILKEMIEKIIDFASNIHKNKDVIKYAFEESLLEKYEKGKIKIKTTRGKVHIYNL